MVLAGGFLLAVLKTAIGLSRISNPWPSPQLSFSGLPQKLTARKRRLFSQPWFLASPNLFTQHHHPNASLCVGLS